MSNNKKSRLYVSVVAAAALCGLSTSVASDNRGYLFAGPSGAWLLTVEFPAVPGSPPPPPAFTETLTFHALGTVSESNTLLNPSSYNPSLVDGCGFTGPGGSPQLNCNGSEGTGTWRRTGRHTLSFVILKFVFDGVTNEHVGYVRIRSNNVRFSRNRIEQDAADSLTEFLIGTDLETAIPIPFGGANSTGSRIR